MPVSDVFFGILSVGELNYYATDVSIAYDDEEIEAQKIFEEYCYRYRFRHSDTDSGILLQIQTFCHRFRHPATDSGILLQI